MPHSQPDALLAQLEEVARAHLAELQDSRLAHRADLILGGITREWQDASGRTVESIDVGPAAIPPESEARSIILAAEIAFTRRTHARMEAHDAEIASRPQIDMRIVTFSVDGRGRPNVCGDLNDLHPEWRRQVIGRLAVQRRSAVHTRPVVGRARARSAGRPRARRSSPRRTNAPPSGDDPDSGGGDPEPPLAPGATPAPFLLAGRDRRISEAMGRIGAVIA